MPRDAAVARINNPRNPEIIIVNVSMNNNAKMQMS